MLGYDSWTDFIATSLAVAVVFEMGIRRGRKEERAKTTTVLPYEWLCPHCLPGLKIKLGHSNKQALEQAKYDHLWTFHPDIMHEQVYGR